MKMEFITASQEETFEVGVKLGRQLSDGSIVALYGELAAGKTSLIKGISEALGGISVESVNSPTFNYLNIYEGLKTLYHFDLYRLSSPEEFLKMGFDEYFYAGGICCIEWAERVRYCLPENRLNIHLEYKQSSRQIIIESVHEEIGF